MFELTEKKINRIYKRYKRKAKQALCKGQINDSLCYVTAAANTAYTFFMGYKDNELEAVLETLSKSIDKREDNKVRNSTSVVFYDSFSGDNGGLVQQYLGALIHEGYRIYYIAERNVALRDDSAIGNLLRGYNQAEIIVIPSKLSSLGKAQFVYDKIVGSDASKLFIHTTPAAATASCAFYALPTSITKYKINLTDHTFWIGTGFIDYSFEFRPYGGMLSSLYRGVPAERILHIPFYPIMNHKGFCGFPATVNDKVILFSGSSYYKIFDKEDTFFKLCKALLEACPDLALLFAGLGDAKVLDGKIKQYGLVGRFIPIGQRSDITEVFEHCDIYLNTYPYGGGLMSQYAAQLGKPIISYSSPDYPPVEEFVCQIKKIQISDVNIHDLVNRTKRLVNDKNYRLSLGNEIRSCVITPDRFNQLFAQCMATGNNPLPYKEDKSFEELRWNIQDKLVFENINKGYYIVMTKILGIKALWQCPVFVLETLFQIIKSNRVKSVIKNRIS